MASAALLAGLVVACASSPPADPDPGGPRAEADCTPEVDEARDRAYGPDPLQRLDVHPAPAEACGQNPVVVWVHGGGWAVGDKDRLEAKRAWARDHGWTLVSVDYRLSDPGVPPGRRVRYPVHNEDVGRAVAWVHDHIAAFGGDPDRIALVGHSAGAQIVSSVGVDERHLDPEPREAVCGVVSLDTEGYDVAARIGDGGRTARAYRNAFGDDPRVWREASPIEHVDASDAPQLVVRRGLPRRQAEQARYALALRRAGVPTTVVPTPGYSHGDVNRLLGDPSDTVLTPAVDTFLEACFAG